MKSNSEKTDEVVFPSHEIAVEEELLPSQGTYVENHHVKASVFGNLFLNKEKYRAQVIPLVKSRETPKKGAEVIGLINRVGRSSIKLSIYYMNKKPTYPPMSALMHISDASNAYIKDIDEYYARGDIISGRIIDAKTFPIQISCKGGQYGVISATCDKCGEKTEKIKENTLRCVECGHVQTRNLSRNYGKITLIPEY